MTNEEKAREISDIYMPDTGFNRSDLYDAAIEMAEWKDKQIIEKVIEWLKENCNLGDYLDWYDWEECRIDTDKLIYDLKRSFNPKPKYEEGGEKL